jgi:hypothetical protein
LATVGFVEIEVFPESKKFPFASFDAYYNRLNKVREASVPN